MANRFLNGLLVTAPTGVSNGAGRTWNKVFYEMVSKVWGATIKDSSGTGWTSYISSANTLGASVSGSPWLFDATADGFTFTSSHKGCYLTLTNFTVPARNGVYRVLSPDPSNSNRAIIDQLYSVHDAGIPHGPDTTINWDLWAPDTSDTPASGDWFVYTGVGDTRAAPYNFDVHVSVQSSTYSYFPEWTVGPLGDWNAGTHVWDSSSNFTRGFINTDGLSAVDECAMFGVGDDDHLAIHTRMMDNNRSSHFTYLGELNPDYIEAEDPTPIILIQGDNRSADYDNCIGFNLSTANSIYNGGRGLSSDGTTEQVYYLPFFNVVAGTSDGVFRGISRVHSATTGRTCTQGLRVECRTPGDWEIRGRLKGVYAANQDIARGTPFGENAEFLHTFASITLDWGGSGCHELRL
jgi:hypothetical protein